MGAGTIFGFAGALAISLQPVAAERRQFAVYPVRASLPDEHVVGSLKKGVACVPAGKLRWSSFTLRSDRAADAVAGALKEAGVPATAADPVFGGAPTALKVSVEITGLSADACTPRYGMLKLGNVGLKGKGSMTVRWRVADAAAKIVIDEITRADFMFADRNASFSMILAAGLAANARQVAPLLSH